MMDRNLKTYFIIKIWIKTDRIIFNPDQSMSSAFYLITSIVNRM